MYKKFSSACFLLGFGDEEKTGNKNFSKTFRLNVKRYRNYKVERRYKNINLPGNFYTKLVYGFDQSIFNKFAWKQFAM